MDESIRRGRLRLARLAETWEAEDDARADQRRRFAALADPAAASRVVVRDNLFQTPEHLATRMVELIPDGDGAILEPSAGLGRLYRAARRRWKHRPLYLVEMASECCRELFAVTSDDGDAVLLQRDFLEVDPGRLGNVDAVLMNPPFRRGSDVRHIRHAARFLRPGGLLVALCYAGTQQERELRPWSDTWETLPPASFSSEGTRAAVALLTWRARPC